jgi:sugar phosphate isomerase/epimerase
MHISNTPLTRRQMLAATGLTFAAGLRAAPPRVNKMHFGFTTYLWGRGWDIPTLIANCTELKAYAVEMRTNMQSAHGVEIELTPEKRREVKKRFADSPVKVLGLATGERFDYLDPEKVKASIENAKGLANLCKDIGGSGIRVFPNDFHKEVPQEKTIEQIAKALNELGKYAGSIGQQIRLENHGSAGRLTTLKLILDQVDQKSVAVKLNSDSKDAVGGNFEENFKLVKNRLGATLHAHDLASTDFPYQLQCNLLMDAGWSGWWLPEMDGKPVDAMAGLKQQRALWDKLIETSLARA